MLGEMFRDGLRYLGFDIRKWEYRFDVVYRKRNPGPYSTPVDAYHVWAANEDEAIEVWRDWVRAADLTEQIEFQEVRRYSDRRRLRRQN